MRTPLVSIIIPFYDRIDWLIKAVDSVLIQSYKNHEIIVINDGSKEDTTDFLLRYNKNIIYIFKENGGPATARNKGIEVAKGKYIAFLDSDDLWKPDKLQKQVNLMEKENAMWSHSNYTFFSDTDSEFSLKKDLGHFKGKVFPQVLVSCPLATPCIIIRRDFLIENPELRFNNKMRFGQDWYLWIHIAIKAPIYYLPDYLVDVRLHGSNASKRARVQLQSKATLWKVMKKHPDTFLGKGKIRGVVKIAYQLCHFGNFIVEAINPKSNYMVEKLSQFFYLAPYIIFKSINKFIYSNK